MARPASCKQVDNTFGPYAGHCRGGFDFTLLFQDSILSILPLALLLLVAPFRISYLFRRTIKVDPSSWLASKLVSGPHSTLSYPSYHVELFLKLDLCIGSLCNLWSATARSCCVVGKADDRQDTGISGQCDHCLRGCARVGNLIFRGARAIYPAIINNTVLLIFDPSAGCRSSQDTVAAILQQCRRYCHHRVPHIQVLSIDIRSR